MSVDMVVSFLDFLIPFSGLIHVLIFSKGAENWDSHVKGTEFKPTEGSEEVMGSQVSHIWVGWPLSRL